MYHVSLLISCIHVYVAARRSTLHQHNATYDAAQRNARRSATQRTTQHDATHDAARRRTTQNDAAHRSATQHDAARRSTTQRDAAQNTQRKTPRSAKIHNKKRPCNAKHCVKDALQRKNTV